jgi:hypothetical protein
MGHCHLLANRLQLDPIACYMHNLLHKLHTNPQSESPIMSTSLAQQFKFDKLTMAAPQALSINGLAAADIIKRSSASVLNGINKTINCK